MIKKYTQKKKKNTDSTELVQKTNNHKSQREGDSDFQNCHTVLFKQKVLRDEKRKHSPCTGKKNQLIEYYL